MAYRKKLLRSFQIFEAAQAKLKEALGAGFEAQYKKEILVEIVTKRFEYTFENLWKFLKELLLEEGIEAASPLRCFQEAFKLGWIDPNQEEVFPLMFKKRNEIVHIYSEEDAFEIYLLIKNTFSSAIFDLFKKGKEKLPF